MTAEDLVDAALAGFDQGELVTVPSLPTETDGPLTLEAALSLAAASNFSLSAAARELDASEGGIMQARTIPNPELATQMEDTRRSTRSTTAQVNIPIELGGKRAARVAGALPGGHRRAFVKAQAAVGDEQADQHPGDRLRHRPADQLGVAGITRAVPFGDNAAARHDQQRAG